MITLSPEASLPRWGLTFVTRMRLWVTRRRGAPDFPFVGKLSTKRERRVASASARLIAHCVSALSMESCRVALSTARGENLSIREGAPCGFQNRPPTGGDWVIDHLLHDEVLAE